MDSACICLTLSWETPRSRAISWSFLGGSQKNLSFITFFCLAERAPRAWRRFSLARLSNPSSLSTCSWLSDGSGEHLPVSGRVLPGGTFREGKISFGNTGLHPGDLLSINAEMVGQTAYVVIFHTARQLFRVFALPLLFSGKAFSGTAWFRSSRCSRTSLCGSGSLP